MNFFRITILIQTILLFVIVQVSCSKSDTETIDVVTSGQDELVINSISAADYASTIDPQAGNHAGDGSIEVIQLNDLFIEVKEKAETPKLSKYAALPTPNTPLVNMTYGTAFKILVLNSLNEYVTEKVAFVGRTIQLDVLMREDYKIIAYTYNTTDTALYAHKLGSLDNRTQIAQPWIVANKEFYIASSPIVIDSYGRKVIDLKFIPVTSRIGIELDVRPIFAKIVGPIKIQTLSNNLFKGGKFNLLTSKISEISNSIPFDSLDEYGEIIVESLQDTCTSYIQNAYTGNSTVKGYFYTLIDQSGVIAESEGENNIFSKVKFVGNSISGTRNNEIEYKETERIGLSDVTLKEALNHTFTYKKGFVGLEHGKSKTFTFKIYRGFPYGNLLWSTTNLYHVGGVNYREESYLFRKDPHTGFQVGSKDYWAPDKLIAGVLANDVQVGDPCNKVYPSGEWRLPTLSEFEELFNEGTGLSRKRNQKDNISSQGYTIIQNSSNLQSQIKFYYFGRAGISGSSPPSYSYYSDGDGINGEANFLYKEDDTGIVSKKHYFAAAWQVLSVYGNNTIINEPNILRNIRCVRDLSSK